MSEVFSASFILSIRISSCVLCFFLIVINLRFLPVTVVRKLVLSSFEKGKTPLEYFMQLQEAFSFFRMFLATAFSHILQGNLTGTVVFLLSLVVVVVVVVVMVVVIVEVVVLVVVVVVVAPAPAVVVVVEVVVVGAAAVVVIVVVDLFKVSCFCCFCIFIQIYNFV